MIANYHTHTYRCKHALGDDEAYVRAAIKAGFQTLGFSDHTPWPYPAYRSNMRIELSEFAGYIENLTRLREKYADQIELKIGLECEYFEAYLPWLADLAATHHLDFLLLGNHFSAPEDKEHIYFSPPLSDEQIAGYGELSEKALASGMYSCFSHPDIYARGMTELSDTVLSVARSISRAASVMDVPLELNIPSFELACCSPETLTAYRTLWEELLSSPVKVILGIDAHNPRSLQETEPVSEAEKFLGILGAQVIDKLPTL